MNAFRTLALLTAFGMMSAAALAQQPPPAGENERAAGAQAQIKGEVKPKDKLVGLPVESSKGEQLGSVVDIVRDKAGKPTYAVVAIDTEATAVPYDRALGMIHGDKVIMSQSKLAAAPKVKQSEWLDQTHSSWRKDADSYWGNTRTASKEDSKDDEKKRSVDR
jgi:hypothetical protein